MSERFQYFEDYQVGLEGTTATRTVTEADVVNFACLTSDYSGIHMDRHATADNIYGGRVAHGLLGSSLVTGMLSFNAPHIVGRGVPGAYFYGFEANYRGGIKLGDTIRVQWRVAEKDNDPAHQGFGLVKTAFQLVDQEGISVYDGFLNTMVRKEADRDAELQLKPGDPWQVPEFIPDPDKVYYVEDYPIGEGRETEGRTITETDIVNFAGLTGDYNPQYVDAEFARESMFGERIAQGMLVFTIGHAYFTRDYGHSQRRRPAIASRIAGHLWDRATFLTPVKIGDTIRCRYKFAASRVSKSKPEVGLLTYDFQIVNQRNEVVQEGSTINMLPARTGLSRQAQLK